MGLPFRITMATVAWLLGETHCFEAPDFLSDIYGYKLFSELQIAEELYECPGNIVTYKLSGIFHWISQISGFQYMLLLFSLCAINGGKITEVELFLDIVLMWTVDSFLCGLWASSAWTLIAFVVSSHYTISQVCDIFL